MSWQENYFLVKSDWESALKGRLSWGTWLVVSVCLGENGDDDNQQQVVPILNQKDWKGFFANNLDSLFFNDKVNLEPTGSSVYWILDEENGIIGNEKQTRAVLDGKDAVKKQWPFCLNCHESCLGCHVCWTWLVRKQKEKRVCTDCGIPCWQGCLMRKTWKSENCQQFFEMFMLAHLYWEDMWILRRARQDIQGLLPCVAFLVCQLGNGFGVAGFGCKQNKNAPPCQCKHGSVEDNLTWKVVNWQGQKQGDLDWLGCLFFLKEKEIYGLTKNHKQGERLDLVKKANGKL